MSKQRKKSNADCLVVDEDAKSLAEEYGAALAQCYKAAREVARAHDERFTYYDLRDEVSGRIDNQLVSVGRADEDGVSAIVDAACILALDDLAIEEVLLAEETYVPCE